MNKEFKIITFILLVLTLIIVFFIGIFGTSISYLSIKEIKNVRTKKDGLIDELKINNIDAVYDKNSNIYYFSVSQELENHSYILKLELGSKYRYKVLDNFMNIIKVEYDKPINIIVYNNKHYSEIKLQLTNLPLINITTKEEITSEDIESDFLYINPNSNEKTLFGNIKIHVRGATTRYLPKKSYKLKFYNEEYSNEKKVYISDFYYGNSFILDGVYRDASKIRNVFSTTIWNDISNDFNNININSEFVELFINNEHKGLYVFTEPINRTKLNLKKSDSVDTGVVIKTNGWRTPGTNKDFSDISDSQYIDYEIKYPNDENMYPEVWDKFLNLISNYYNPEIKVTDKVIKETFNIKNYLDIIIFNSFVTNMDSCLKRNSYYYMKSLDDKVYTQPWDMEFTYGYYMDETRLKDFEYDKIYCQFYHEDAIEINKLLVDRYWMLRKDVLTKTYFDNLLDKYKNILTKGATKRDSELWNEYDVEKEIEDIRIWLHKRLEFFDEYVGSLEDE